MTKTWIALLALVLTSAALHAAQPTTATQPLGEPKSAPVKTVPDIPPTPITTTYGSADSACGPACPACPTTNACTTTCGKCPSRPWFDLGLGTREHPCLARLKEWITYRQCERTPFSCGCYIRPIPAGYEWFLYPGCASKDCGGCCKAPCACTGCGK